MASSDEVVEGCRHDRAPLRRLGKIRHERTGKSVYVLLCTGCGFTVTTEQLRRLRNSGSGSVARRAPGWAPTVNYRPVG
jgi:hypothetical protein